MTPPEISVVVTAHDRRQFLPLAIESVLGQTLPRARFEVIVVAPFSDPDLEAYLTKEGIRYVQSSAPGLGAKVCEALRLCRGSVISFLEDDDLFEPNKLELTLTLFNASPTLGYYRNGFLLIDTQGNLQSGDPGQRRTLRALAAIGSVTFSRRTYRKAFKYLARLDPAYSLSSISVRSEVLRGKLDYLEGIHLAVDVFSFFAALTSPLELRLDNVRLTRVRIHSASASNPSISGARDKLVALDRFIQSNLESVRRVRDMVASAGDPPVLATIEAYLSAQEVIACLRNPLRDRRRVALNLGTLVRGWDPFVVHSFRGVLTAGILYVAAPRFSQACYSVAKQLGF